MTDPGKSTVRSAMIDAHHHLWSAADTDARPWLRQTTGEGPAALPADFDVDAYRQALAQVDLLGSVHVEAGWAGDPVGETLWLAGQRARSGLPSAIVAYADLTHPQAGALLDRHLVAGPVRGIRARLTFDRDRLAALRSGDNPTCSHEWRRGYALLAARGLSFELQAPPRLLADAAALADAFPDIPLVLSHAAFPFFAGGGGIQLWRRALPAIAARPNVIFKLSGLAMDRPDLQADDIRAVAHPALEWFGADRVMFGTNYPIDLRRLSPRVHLQRHFAALADLSASERAAVFHGTARRLYQITSASPS